MGLGSGLPRKAPGTWGTVGGLVAMLPVLWLPPYMAWAWVFVGVVFGSFICGRTATELRVGDHGSIVWDEWAGIWIALALVPQTWGAWLAAFVLFRLFDIAKPWPVNRAEKLKPIGLGIMADDVLAGFLAGLLTLGFIKIPL